MELKELDFSKTNIFDSMCTRLSSTSFRFGELGDIDLTYYCINLKRVIDAADALSSHLQQSSKAPSNSEFASNPPLPAIRELLPFGCAPRDLLHAVAGLYDVALSEMSPTTIYAATTDPLSYTVIALLSPEDANRWALHRATYVKMKSKKEPSTEETSVFRNNLPQSTKQKSKKETKSARQYKQFRGRNSRIGPVRRQRNRAEHFCRCVHGLCEHRIGRVWGRDWRGGDGGGTRRRHHWGFLRLFYWHLLVHPGSATEKVAFSWANRSQTIRIAVVWRFCKNAQLLKQQSPAKLQVDENNGLWERPPTHRFRHRVRGLRVAPRRPAASKSSAAPSPNWRLASRVASCRPARSRLARAPGARRPSRSWVRRRPHASFKCTCSPCGGRSGDSDSGARSWHSAWLPNASATTTTRWCTPTQTQCPSSPNSGSPTTRSSIGKLPYSA